jgi:hypothetical protein
LRRLAGSPFFVIYDRRVPNRSENIDGIAITRSGVANVDAKGKRGMWHDEGGIITYNGRYPDTKTTEWETGEIAKVLDKAFGKDVIPVTSIWALHTKGELPFIVRIFGSTRVMPSRMVASTIAKQPVRISRKQVREVHRLLNDKLQRA